MGWLLYLSLSGLAMTVISTLVMLATVLQMIRIINRDPGPEGWIPIWSVFTKTAYLYHPIQRYKVRIGTDLLYRTLQLCWIIFGIGITSVFASSIADHFSKH
jgi:hypothetical protein